MLLAVWIVVAVLSVVVLGILAYGVAGAQARLAREVAAFEREVRPVLLEVTAATERARDGQRQGAGDAG